MFIVMGGTGHVGGAVADELLAHNQPVAILTRDPAGADAWAAKGAMIVRADAENVASLKQAFRNGSRIFLLNPPADTAGNTDTDERRTIANILSALEGSKLEKVVAASTYGAQPGDAVGDLSTLWEFEDGLRAQSVPAAINRGAYYMTNWLGFADVVRTTGVLPSMFPADTEMPMVAPADLGRIAVERLMEGVADTGIQHIEGPARYTPQDVANTFAAVFGRDVSVDVAPRQTWQAVFQGAGFSPEAAAAYTRMTAVSLDGGFGKPVSPRRGTTELDQFITGAVSVFPDVGQLGSNGQIDA